MLSVSCLIAHAWLRHKEEDKYVSQQDSGTAQATEGETSVEYRQNKVRHKSIGRFLLNYYAIVELLTSLNALEGRMPKRSVIKRSVIYRPFIYRYFVSLTVRFNFVSLCFGC